MIKYLIILIFVVFISAIVVVAEDSGAENNSVGYSRAEDNLPVLLKTGITRDFAGRLPGDVASRRTGDFASGRVGRGGNVVSKYRELTLEEERVILHKGTEPPNSGKYNHFSGDGNYQCRQCGSKLYDSSSKFDSGCGWPAFDSNIEGNVKRIPDKDGRRTEIVCANCGGHLGHVFEGEGLTEKNVRHCVNSISIDFVAKGSEAKSVEAEAKSVGEGRESIIVAGGCFWGVEYWLKKEPGVIKTTVGYTGGQVTNPVYKEVCSGTTGHYEAVEVIYSPFKTTAEKILRVFFETHDPTQEGRQGPDVGERYSSVIFYKDEEQKETALKLIGLLEKKGLNVVTKLLKADKFWPGEDYHQDYYEKKGAVPYCHARKTLF